MEPIILMPGEGSGGRVGGARVVFKADAETTDGRFGLNETTLEANFAGPVPHRHGETLDMYYVLEGTLTIHLEGHAIAAPAGSFVAIPPGVVHAFSNPSPTRTRMLNMTVPGGFEGYLKEVIATRGEAATQEYLREIAARYDFIPAD